MVKDHHSQEVYNFWYKPCGICKESLSFGFSCSGPRFCRTWWEAGAEEEALRKALGLSKSDGWNMVKLFLNGIFIINMFSRNFMNVCLFHDSGHQIWGLVFSSWVGGWLHVDPKTSYDVSSGRLYSSDHLVFEESGQIYDNFPSFHFTNLGFAIFAMRHPLRLVNRQQGNSAFPIDDPVEFQDVPAMFDDAGGYINLGIPLLGILGIPWIWLLGGELPTNRLAGFELTLVISMGFLWGQVVHVNN